MWSRFTPDPPSLAVDLRRFPCARKGYPLTDLYHMVLHNTSRRCGCRSERAVNNRLNAGGKGRAHVAAKTKGGSEMTKSTAQLPPEKRCRKGASVTLGTRTIRATTVYSLALALAMLNAGAQAGTADKKIALSNNYAGNSWRQAMLASWDKIGKKAVADKIVAAANAFTAASSDAAAQAAQIQNLTLQGYDAIVVNAASPTALNGAVKAACDAGIVVVSFDGFVTEPCAWRVTTNLHENGAEEVRQLAKRLPNGGNLIEIRGLAGTSIDVAIHEGIEAELKNHPNLKVVSTVTGSWDQTTAQKAVATVLPSLPEIVGVVDQGGDGYGTAEAFKAAGRKVPIIMMGNRQDELAWWLQQRNLNGYDTWSGAQAPGMGTFAFWVAQQILSGRKDIPHDLTMPLMVINPAHLDDVVKSTPVGSVANIEYTQDDVIKAIAGVGK
jgi:ribose transport system substrate-binding protein